MDNFDGNCIGNGDKAEDERDALGNIRHTNQSVVANMPTERNATHYKMDHKNRGIALIFNHETFENGSLKPRNGTHVDCNGFANLLKKMGFAVWVFQDLGYMDIYEQVRKAAKEDHTDNDCFLMAVLSHGELGILHARDTSYKPDTLWTPFTADRCPTLAGKPKLFFIQACQGDRLDAGVTLSRTETDGNMAHTYRIPVQADFLIAYSTVPGYFSWRNTTRGSWFMQALCEEFTINGHELDLLTILTFVCQRVAIDYESNTPDVPYMHRQKQIPCITTMLTRLLKFPKTGSEIVENTIIEEVKVKNKGKGMLSGIFNNIGKTQSYQVN